MILRIKNRQGNSISCLVDYPRVKTPRGAVLVIHGFKGWSKERHLDELSKGLVGAGFITLRPDLTKDPGKSYLPFFEMTYGGELSDVADVLDAFFQIESVDPNRVGICGHSLGGMIAAETASKNPRIKSLVILSAVYDWRFLAKHLFNKPFAEVQKDFKRQGWSTVWSRTLERELQIGKAFYEDVFMRSADKFVKDIKCPALIISSEKDENVSQDHADKYLENIGSGLKAMEIIAGSNHTYKTGDSLSEVVHFTVDWFTKTLV